jgi:hypothetical protein
MVREMAHAGGPMTVFLQVPEDFEQRLRVVLHAIGYWGQSSSLVSCLGVTNAPPVRGECALPLALLDERALLRPYFTCLATEFRSDRLAWEEVVATDETPRAEALRLDVYVWPIVTRHRYGTQKLLVRAPLADGAERAERREG